MNKGEFNELLLKVMLVYLRDSGQADSKLGQINSVGFNGVEYGSFPKHLRIQDLYQISESSLKQLAESLNIGKSPARSKSDVSINGYGYSVKSFEAAPPALVNHTARPGFETACRCVNVDIADLDKIIDEYWSKRIAGTIKEDVKNTDMHSPFTHRRSVLAPLLQYFLFTGTGAGPSRHKADYILDCNNPITYQEWEVYTPATVIDKIWMKLVFSLRSKKGMPADYPKMQNVSKKNSVQRWTQYFQGSYRGALHIRATR